MGHDAEETLSPETLLLRKPADALTAAEIAAAARPAMTMLGSFLRATNAGIALSAPQSVVLSQLTASRALPITMLAAADGRAVSTMTEIVNRLVAAGLVTKHDGMEDRRQVCVSITEKGRDTLAGSLRLRTEALAQRIEKLSPADQRALAAALPALWQLAEINPDMWPRMEARSKRTSRRRRPPAAQADAGRG
jgi:DNA-binding MarR family transcriptional regulator